MSAPTSTAPPPLELTSDEAEVLAAYRSMTPWARSLLLDTAKRCLKTWPLPRLVPRLRLVTGAKS